MKQRLLTLSILAAATTLSQAALYTWTGGDGPWGDGNHWTHPGSSNATPNPAKDNVVIGNGSTVTRGGNLSFEKTLEPLSIRTSSLVVTGVALVLPG